MYVYKYTVAVNRIVTVKENLIIFNAMHYFSFHDTYIYICLHLSKMLLIIIKHFDICNVE